jgi:lipopolysaccharide export system permease protein
MKISPTLSRYLARTYLINTLFLLLALLGVIYLFDTVELMRRAGKIGEVPLPVILQMGLLKLPEVGQMLLPFAILFGAMFTFWQMTRRYELIVVRAAGYSCWQFLTPIIGVALTIGILHITVINPLSALLLGRFQQMENTYLTRQDNQIALFKEGLWLRQGTESGYVILHAAKIEQPSWKLKNVMALFFSNDDRFLKRLDAGMAIARGGRVVVPGCECQQSRRPAPERKRLYIAYRVDRGGYRGKFFICGGNVILETSGPYTHIWRTRGSMQVR